MGAVWLCFELSWLQLKSEADVSRQVLAVCAFIRFSFHTLPGGRLVCQMSSLASRLQFQPDVQKLWLAAKEEDMHVLLCIFCKHSVSWDECTAPVKGGAQCLNSLAHVKKHPQGLAHKTKVYLWDFLKKDSNFLLF